MQAREGRHAKAHQSTPAKADGRRDESNKVDQFRAVSKGRLVSVQVSVKDNNVDQALRALKKKMQREGIYREMKMRRSFEKPSERRAREKAEAVRRYRKLMRKRMDREGY